MNIKKQHPKEELLKTLAKRYFDELEKGIVEHTYYSELRGGDITYQTNDYKKTKLKRIRLLMSEVMREIENE